MCIPSPYMYYGEGLATMFISRQMLWLCVQLQWLLVNYCPSKKPCSQINPVKSVLSNHLRSKVSHQVICFMASLCLDHFVK